MLLGGSCKPPPGVRFAVKRWWLSGRSLLRTSRSQLAPSFNRSRRAKRFRRNGLRATTRMDLETALPVGRRQRTPSRIRRRRKALPVQDQAARSCSIQRLAFSRSPMGFVRAFEEILLSVSMGYRSMGFLWATSTRSRRSALAPIVSLAFSHRETVSGETPITRAKSTPEYPRCFRRNRTSLLLRRDVCLTIAFASVA